MTMRTPLRCRPTKLNCRVTRRQSFRALGRSAIGALRLQPVDNLDKFVTLVISKLPDQTDENADKTKQPKIFGGKFKRRESRVITKHQQP